MNPDCLLKKLDSVNFRVKHSTHLSLKTGFEHFAEPDAGLIPQRNDVPTENDWSRSIQLDGLLFNEFLKLCQRGGQVSRKRWPTFEVRFDQSNKLSDRRLSEPSIQATNRSESWFWLSMDQVLGNQWFNDFNHLFRAADAEKKRTGERYSRRAVFVSVPAAINEFSRRRLTQIVTQRRKQQHCSIERIKLLTQCNYRSRITHVQGMNPDISFRVPLGILRHSRKSGEFRETRKPLVLAQQRQLATWRLTVQRPLLPLVPVEKDRGRIVINVARQVAIRFRHDLRTRCTNR